MEFWQRITWFDFVSFYIINRQWVLFPTGNNHCSVGTRATWQNTKHSELGMLIAALHAYYVLVRIMRRDIPVDVLYSNVCSVLHRTPLFSPNPGKQRWLNWWRTFSLSEPGSSTGITAFTKTTSRDIRDWATQERWHCWWWETATGLCSSIRSHFMENGKSFLYSVHVQGRVSTRAFQQTWAWKVAWRSGYCGNNHVKCNWRKKKKSII